MIHGQFLGNQRCVAILKASHESTASLQERGMGCQFLLDAVLSKCRAVVPFVSES